ncbi:FAD-binding oxidoreductase [Sphingosinicellaceae bacterium]|nr:FAD-binding oxidoreductase [Sphingosinicellaceae bacterium]
MDRADVLVVGGGLTGCATAFHLARAGASVILIEAGELNGGASGQNAGSLHFQIERRFLENGEALAEQATRVLALNRLAVADWQGLQAMFDDDLEIVMDGGLMVAETAAEVAQLQRKVVREQAMGLATRLIGGDELRGLAPYLATTIQAASWLGSEGHANPRTIARVFARAAIADGVDVRTRTVLTGATKHHGGYAVDLASGDVATTVQADRVLLATGAATATVGALFNLHLPIFPAGLTMNITDRRPQFLPHLVQHVGRRLSMKQAHSGNVLIGGGWSSTLRKSPTGGFDVSRPPELQLASVQGNLRAAVDTVPAVASLNIIRSWTGIVALTVDQLPIVGQVAPGLFVAAGGSGFTLGPTFARLLAAQMAGSQPAPELAIFGPGRFDHLNGFMG